MILMYHHIAPPEVVPKDRAPLEGWNFIHSPKGFERQLVELRRRGYRFVSLGSLVDDLKRNAIEPTKTIALTFDDGWLDNFSYAFPILKGLSIPAIFFCTTRHIQNGVNEAKKMTVAQLQELLAAGMSIGGHTRAHHDLTKLTLEQAREEIAGCKSDLEQALGVEVKFFAYPGGAFNQDVVRLTQEAGYTAACSVLGPAHNDRSSLFWLYRDVLSESMTTWADRYRLSPPMRWLLQYRVARRLNKRLELPTF
jgi:peptidoglycan/xylan/chitin deacetylase (PgdA/CDA1 family)